MRDTSGGTSQVLERQRGLYERQIWLLEEHIEKLNDQVRELQKQLSQAQEQPQAPEQLEPHLEPQDQGRSLYRIVLDCLCCF